MRTASPETILEPPRLRLQSATGFSLVPTDQVGAPGGTECRTTTATATLTMARGDTLTFERIDLPGVNRGAAGCRGLRQATLIRSRFPDLEMYRLEPRAGATYLVAQLAFFAAFIVGAHIAQ
jgi:hypothetical protein